MDYPGKVITKTQVTPTQTSASGNWTLDDQAAAIKNNNWPVALVPNPISKSLRFNSADSAYLNRTLTTPTDGKRWTYSFWIKRVSFATNQPVLTAYTDANNQATLYYTTGNKLYWLSTTGGSTYTQFRTDAVYRDASAWYHFVVVFDSTNATSTDRIKMYVNGTSLTCEAGQYIAPGLNTTAFVNTAIGHRIGNDQNLSIYNNAYLTEVNFIDGQALTPASFGMTNPQTGQWIPLKYSGTYGTNGFYLNFKDATSTTTLGYDYSGNANNWTTNNFSVTAGAGNDSLTDVPTPWFAYNTTGDVGGVVRGNYCTLNPLAKNSTPTLSNGNLDMSGYNAFGTIYSTFGVSSGKWYWEEICGGNDNMIGIASTYNLDNYPGQTGTSVAYNTVGGGLNASNVTVSGTTSSYGSGDIISVALDMDNGKCWWAKNGTWQNLGVPASGTNASATGLSGTFFPVFRSPSSGTSSCNFGQRPFAYTPPTGFRSLCTTNLPATAIGFGLTNQGDDYFNIVLWAGNSTSGRQITGYGFAPDWVWVKNRTLAGRNHQLYDTVRGANKGLSSNTTTAEDTSTTNITAFGSDGFTVGNDNNVNSTGDNFVGWAWKASGSTVSNTAGTITSTVSANTTAGFSVVTWTGAGSSGTIGHGLGVTPSMIIVKNRSGTQFWFVNHTSISATQNLYLNGTDSVQSDGIFTARGATTFGVGAGVAASSTNYVAYCFAAVPGYSAFGSYTGNGSTDGPFVYVGFRPRYFMAKRTDAAGNSWILLDTARNTYNAVDAFLSADLSNAETTSYPVDFLSNGFKIRATTSNLNTSSGTYIYMAFAEFPFQFANAR